MSVRRMVYRACCRLSEALAVSSAVLLVEPLASAEEPRSVGEPRVLAEPAEILRIVDAFDEMNPYDVHLALGFRYTTRRGDIYREGTESSTDTYTRAGVPVAAYAETTSRLETRADIGLYHDVALVIRMPLILARSSELRSLHGSEAHQADYLAGAYDADGTREQLFSIPFETPSRSGIEYLALGLDVGLMNQHRDSVLPTWIVGAETRLSVSEPMHACNASPQSGQVSCASPGDLNRDGEREGSDGAGGPRSPGISRGTTGLELHTYFSRRLRAIEPYGGIRVLAEFANANSDFEALDASGAAVRNVPVEGTLLVGLGAYPWQALDKYQRIALDFRYEGTYRSEGLDYSELFDALGSSDARNSLRTANHTEYMAGEDAQGNPGSVVDPDSRAVYFNGITGVQQHLAHRLLSEVTWQAGEYVRFKAGASYRYTQAHLITSAQSCNSASGGTPNTSGRCRSVTHSSDGSTTIRATGTPNPNYRPAIDAVGQRFKMDGTHEIDAWVAAVLMF